MKQEELTQEKISKRIGYSRAYVAQILSCRALMSGAFLKALLDENFDVQWILTGKSDREIKNKLIEELKKQCNDIANLEKLLLKALGNGNKLSYDDIKNEF